MHIIWQFSKSGPNSDVYAHQTVLTIGHTQIENNYRIRLINNSTDLITTNNLEIRKLQVSDSGWYECQVPTKPTQKSYVYLQVHGVPKITVNRKQTDLIELTCRVENKPVNSSHLFWTFNSDKIVAGTTVDNYGFQMNRSLRRRNNLNKGFTVMNNDRLNITRLRITDLNESHKGVYRCHYDKIETEFHLDHLFTGMLVLIFISLKDSCKNIFKKQILFSDSQRSNLKYEEKLVDDEHASRLGLNKAFRVFSEVNSLKFASIGSFLFCFLTRF